MQYIHSHIRPKGCISPGICENRQTMNAHSIFLLGLIVILTSPASGIAAENEDARLTAFFKEYLDESFRLRPMDATRLGDHHFDHLLDDLSATARAGWKNQL